MNVVVDEVYSELRTINDSLMMVGDLCQPDAWIEPKLMSACLALHTRCIDAALEKLNAEFYSH